jgi:hypothetical protein
MIRSQGRYFTEKQIERILFLLRETEMTLPEIATRMTCSRSAIAAINQRFQVRDYEGKRSHWTLWAANPHIEEHRESQTV